MFRQLTLAICAIFIYCTLAAQQSFPKTFLWRISGNHLSKPSYLYGTMHLQDRNLFTFGDSIYHAIEVSDGFAIELNPVEMMDTLFSMFSMPDNSPLVKNILSKSEYEKIAGKLSKKLKMPADQVTVEKIEEERRNWLSATRKKHDMATFMDMYFYTIAQNQGKYVGGIEDLEDQIGLMNDMSASDIEKYLQEDNESRLKSLNDMKSIYINRNLEKIGALTLDGSSLALIKRNIKMARRLDSLSRIRNTFFAVGAAHLPGDSGLIALLRKRGFIVEPVISSNYLKPEEYHYTKKEVRWIDVEDDHKMSSVKMPGEPASVTVSDVIQMRMYMDLSNTFCYGISVVPMSAAVKNDDSVFVRLIDNFKTQGYEIISTKKTEELGAKVMEMTMRNDGFLRYKLFIKSNKLFMLIFGVQDKEKLITPEGDKFFNSFTINDSAINQKTEWQVFTDNENAFSISLPTEPLSKFDKGTPQTFFDAYTYTASDFSDGSYYFIVVKNSLPGFYILNDSTIFEGYKESLLQSADATLLNVTEISVNGYHGYKMLLGKKDNDKSYVLQVRMIFRGNRVYMPVVVTEKGKENSDGPEAFFNSFSLLPVKENKWKQHTSPGNNFIAWGPAEFITRKVDSSAEVSPVKTFIATDKGNVVDYSIEAEPFSKYYWINSDSAFFKNMANAFYTTEDSLIYYHKLKGDTAGAELLIKLHNSDIYKRLRTLLNGDTLYTLFSYFPQELKDNSRQNLFFDEFKFVHPQANTIFTNKQDQLLSALKSADRETRSEALDVLDDIEFTRKDLPFLHGAWIDAYPADSNLYRNINYYVGEKISALHDSLTLDFIAQNYSRFNIVQPELQMNMLEVLADCKTERAYSILKKLLLFHPPTAGPVYNFIGKLSDSLLLSENLFPEVSRLYTDSICGGGLVKLTADLIDSNIINISGIRNGLPFIYSLAENQLAEMKSHPDAYADYNYAVINILEKINSDEAISLLKSFMETGDMAVKYDAVTALAKLKQPVPAPVLYSIAANNGYRTQLYSFLKTINKAVLFPKEFLTPQKFAEAYVYNYAVEDTDSLSLEAKGERTIKVNGKLQRYFLFKVNTVYDGDAFSYLGICGPFENKKNTEINEDAVRVEVFYDEEYNPASVEKFVQQFINPEPEEAGE